MANKPPTPEYNKSGDCPKNKAKKVFETVLIEWVLGINPYGDMLCIFDQKVYQIFHTQKYINKHHLIMYNADRLIYKVRYYPLKKMLQIRELHTKKIMRFYE